MKGRDAVSRIVATGYAYPSDKVDNDEYLARCRFPLSDVDALIRDTRMKSRLWCGPGENSWTLAREAARMAVEEVPGLADEIDLVVVASGTTLPFANPPEPDNPGSGDLAPRVLRDVLRRPALGFDVKACYCAGFLRSLQIADALLVSGGYRAALVVAAEQPGRMAVAETNQSSFCFLVGDAAGAFVLRRVPPGEGGGLVDHVGSLDGSKLGWAGVGSDGASMVMRGSQAARSTLDLMTACGLDLLERNDLTPGDVDWLVPLQTHAGLVGSLAEAMGWPRDRVLWNGDVTGFSGSASIPACIAENLRKGVLARGDLVLSVAVGAGLSSAGSLYRL